VSGRIGPYLIESRLGVGGMGVVHVARDEALQRRVALKVISPHPADDEEFRACFVREARAMAFADLPEMKAALTSATLTCLSAGCGGQPAWDAPSGPSRPPGRQLRGRG
jgi:serine/threonine protein kinase